MRYKLLLLIFFALFLPMNLYSRALRHISISDVKKKHQQKLADQSIIEEKEKQEKKYLNYMMEKKRYNWRKELTEQMTTSDVFFTTLPATGDVNLAYPQWNIIDGQGYSVSGGTLTIGAGQVNDGAVASFDSSLYSNLVFDASISGSSIFGVFISGVDDPLVLSSSSGTYSVNVNQSKNLVLLFLASGVSGNVSISNLRFQRRTPLNVFVPLDNPEATSFVRTGSGDLSPAEKQKKLKEMLEASDEYVQQMYGDEFPGTGAVPPGELGDTPGVEIAQVQPIEPAQQRRGATGVGVPDTKELPGPRPAPGKMNYPPEWTQWKNA